MPTIKQIKHERPVNIPLLRVAAYCRVSTDSADQLHSYAAQIEYYTKYIDRHPNWELVDIFADEGLSGTKLDNRDDLNRMIADCKRNKIDRILVKSVSRFARNTYDSLSLTRLLKSLGVSVYFEEQDIDTAKMDDEFLLTMQSEAAQNESITISDNMRWSYRRRMEKGEFLGSVPAYGYKLAGSTLEIYEPEAEVVRRIFEHYLSGMGKQAITNLMNKEAAPRRYGNQRWHCFTVDYILNNERYIGDALLQKKYTTGFPFKKVRNKGEVPQYYVENSHPAIITREDFEAVKKLQQERKRGGAYTKTKGGYALSGKLICPDCGHPFRRIVIHDVAYWGCSHYLTTQSDCRTTRYSEEVIHNAFVLLTYKLIANRKTIIEPLIEQLTEIQRRHSGVYNKVYEIDRQIAELNSRGITIANHHAKGYIDVTEFTARTGEVNRQLSEHRAERRRLISEDENDALLSDLCELNEVLTATDPQNAFNEELFSQIIKNIKAISHEELCFTLKGGLELNETIIKTERRKNVCKQTEPSHTAML